MNGTCFVHKQRAYDVDLLGRPRKKFPARNQEISSRKCCQFSGRQSVHERTDARPVHRTDTHRAGLAAGVKHTLAERLPCEPSYGFSHKVRLGMTERAVGRDNGVARLDDDTPIKDQNSPERVIAGSPCLSRKLNRP